VILLDTNVLIDAFDPDAPFHTWASSLLRKGLLGDGVAINPMILAELCVGDAQPETVAERLQDLGVVLLDLPARASPRCAQAYAAFLENRRKQAGPATPKIPLPDFFIGAHAAFLKLPLATADEARYRTYYPEIQLITPHG
jgi:predicted nucleic acid-binding protein